MCRCSGFFGQLFTLRSVRHTECLILCSSCECLRLLQAAFLFFSKLFCGRDLNMTGCSQARDILGRSRLERLRLGCCQRLIGLRDRKRMRFGDDLRRIERDTVRGFGLAALLHVVADCRICATSSSERRCCGLKDGAEGSS